jgi:hypothetical protein
MHVLDTNVVAKYESKDLPMNDEFFLCFAKRKVKNFLCFCEVSLLDHCEFEFASDGGFDSGSIKFGVALCSVCIALLI